MRWPFGKKEKRSPTEEITLKEMEPFATEFLEGPAYSGVRVTERRAMGLSAHFACVRVISTTLASLPIHIYERTKEGKRRAYDHPLFPLLHAKPNPEMTAFSFIEALQAQICNRGAAFAEIVYSRKGEIAELWPIPPGVCRPQRNPKTKELEYYFPKTGDILPNWKILHIPGLSFDGLNSFSPVGLFMQTFGMGIAVEEYGSRFFGQGTHVGAVITHPKTLSDVAYTRLKTELSDKYRGLEHSHGVVFLEEDMKYTRLGMNMEEVQFIETRKLTVTEMARIHGVPPHLIADLERATFSNIEEQSIEAVVYLFRPWAVRWEQALNARLLTPEEQERYYVKFEVDGLLRGNIKSRYEAYAIGRTNGWLSQNEIREKEDMNPLPGGQGNTYLTPLNMAEANNPKKEDKREEL
ncbi:MAG: phage portal protein [Treponema sp.]|jgi:HK97 family phage portal protein|nr:phage portal protein [Treponema sp.]